MGKLALFGFIVGIIVLAEVISLLQLRASITSYSRYWQQRSTQSGQLTYVALGDSAAQGIGASRAEHGYVGVIAQRLAEKTGKTVRVINLGVSGAKLQDVITKQLPELQHYRPDFVTIEAGANDIVSFDAASFKTRFDLLAPQLPAGTVVANMPNFGGRISRNGPVQQANAIISAAAAKQHFMVADLYSATKNNESVLNYAADFFHPSNRGYQNWANAFWDVLKNQ